MGCPGSSRVGHPQLGDRGPYRIRLKWTFGIRRKDHGLPGAFGGDAMGAVLGAVLAGAASCAAALPRRRRGPARWRSAAMQWARFWVRCWPARHHARLRCRGVGAGRRSHLARPTPPSPPRPPPAGNGSGIAVTTGAAVSAIAPTLPALRRRRRRGRRLPVMAPGLPSLPVPPSPVDGEGPVWSIGNGPPTRGDVRPGDPVGWFPGGVQGLTVKDRFGR